MRNEIWCPLNVYFPFLSHHKVFDGRVSFSAFRASQWAVGQSQQKTKRVKKELLGAAAGHRAQKDFFSRTDKTDFVFRMMDDDGPFIREEIHQNVLISKVGLRSLQAIDEPCLCSLVLIFAGPPPPTKEPFATWSGSPGEAVFAALFKSPFQLNG